MELKKDNERPKTTDEVRDLIIKIKLETGFGYTKIRQELAKLGIKVSRQTVKNILVAAGLHEDPNTGKDFWDAFLKLHADTMLQCGYMSKPLWTSKGIIDLFMIVFIHIGTRRIWMPPSTANPNSKWVEQQARNFLMHSEDIGLETKLLMHDRNTKFTKEFGEIIKSTGCGIKKTPIRSPNLQAHVERVVQTLKHEVLNEFVVVSEKHLNHICRGAQDWYNNERGHSVRENLPPGWSEHPEEVQTIKLKDVDYSTRLGGLLKHYWRRAA
ncbi:MAG: transposase [Planctomicrobium sp.]|jgi:putative transposase|nr:transposase [Planctomicrobium sp.]